MKKKILLSTGNEIIDTIVSRAIDSTTASLKKVPVQGLKKSIETENPDIIILLDNYFASKSIKLDKKTSFLPVISLFLNETDKEKESHADWAWALGENLGLLKKIIANSLKNKTQKQKRILLVDDDVIVHKLVKTALQGEDYTFVDTFDGEEALLELRKSAPHLVITDIEMPKLNGFGLCKQIKEDPKIASLPILMLSSLSNVEMVEKGFEAGTDDYITKPFTTEQFVDKVEYLLSRSEKSRSEKILLVDNSNTVLKLMVNALSPQGFTILCAENGEEGLQVARREIPDIIISDLEMPVMNGFDFCEKIKKDPETKEIPFIALTGKDSKGARGLGKKSGIDFFIVKPFTVEKVIVLIERFLAERRELSQLEKNMVIASITALAKALDERDAYTRYHSENVAKYATKLAQALTLPEGEIEEIRISGLLHDIGKIGIRDAILLKPGSLTDEEYSIIKGHPEKGASILKPIQSLKNIIPNILHHHEYINGRGYPKGLKGEEIPLGARIIGVADTYDALTSNRAYRKGMTQEKAISILKEVAGTQLCKKCVDIFLMTV